MSLTTAKPFESYDAGVFDVLKELGTSQEELRRNLHDPQFEYPDENKGELDMVRYNRGKLDGLIAVMKHHLKGDHS